MKTDIITSTQNDVKTEQTNGKGMSQFGMGMMIVLFTVAQFTTSYIVFAFALIWIPVYYYIKKRYLDPRIGIVKLKQKPELKSLIWGIVLAVMIVAVFVGIASKLKTGQPTGTTKIWISVLIGFVTGFILVITYNNRDRSSKLIYANYGIVLILLLSLFIGKITETRGYITLIIYGLYHICAGILRFIHFVKTTPEVQDEE